MIRPATQADSAAIAAIYNTYVTETTVSFEVEPVDVAQMANRIGDVQAANLPWLVYCVDNVVVGYAYASKWKPRFAYRFSVEVSVYLDNTQRGKQFGSQLYRALLEQLRTQGIHTAMGGIALPNPASIAMHEKMGFRKVAHFEQVGFKFEQWLDVGYWQIQL